MDGLDEDDVNEVQLGTFDDSDEGIFEGIELHNMNASDQSVLDGTKEGVLDGMIL